MASEQAILRAMDTLTRPVSSVAEVAALHPTQRSGRSVLRHRNTVGVGIGYKITKGKPTKEKVLQVYVVRKRSKHRLKGHELIPEAVAAGRELVSTDVIEVGKIRPETLITRAPIQPGYSIGHMKVSAGTFGALVTRGKSYAALSNSHVLAAAGKGKKGDVILYPGKVDRGRQPKDQVAKLAAFRRFETGGDYTNTIDAAVATFDRDRVKSLRSDIKGLGIPRGTTKAVLGMAVTKTGRTTATTKGQVLGLRARLQIEYEGVGLVGFKDQVFCTRYSKPGDSGSLVLDAKSKRAVGLHFAGGAKGSFFNPIDRVLKAMGSTLVTTKVH